MHPVLGRVVEKAQQPLGLAGDLGDRLGPLDSIVTGEGVDRPLGVAAVLGADDLVQRLAGAGVDASGQRAKNIPGHVLPAALLAGGGEDLPQRPPQPKRPVADHHHRRAHAAAAQVAQQLGPVIGRLSGPVGDRDQLFSAVGADPDDHQAAQPAPLAQADVEVDPISPAVHVVDPMKVAPLEGLAFGLPLGAQPGDHRGRQACRRAEQLLQRWHEILAGQPVQVQQRQHLGHLRAAPCPPGQDLAVELPALPGVGVHPPVVHPGADDLDLPRAGGDLAGWGVAVAAHQPVPALVDQPGMGGDVGVDLGLQRHRQHPPRALPKQLVQVQAQLGLGSLVCDYTQHRGVPSSPAVVRRRPSHRSGWKVRRVLMPGAHPQVSTISRMRQTSAVPIWREHYSKMPTWRAHALNGPVLRRPDWKGRWLTSGLAGLPRLIGARPESSSSTERISQRVRHSRHEAAPGKRIVHSATVANRSDNYRLRRDQSSRLFSNALLRDLSRHRRVTHRGVTEERAARGAPARTLRARSGHALFFTTSTESASLHPAGKCPNVMSPSAFGGLLRNVLAHVGDARTTAIVNVAPTSPVPVSPIG
jgi:hypothetical protein